MTEFINFSKFKDRYQQVPVEEYPNRVCEVVPDPMVSVHVGTYQHADFIRDCLDGVLMQETSFPFEILIGEDESDDGTREICKKYADEHPDKIRLFLHHRKNNIRIHGRPTGKFQQTYTRFMCRGKYIALCQGDDYWRDKDKIKKQFERLERNDSDKLSYHDAKSIRGGSVVQESALPDRNKRNIKGSELKGGKHLITQTLMFSNILNAYPQEYFKVTNTDIFLISLIGEKGDGVYQSNIDRSVYRLHDNSMWSSIKKKKKLRENEDTRAKMCKYYKNKGDITTARKCVLDLINFRKSIIRAQIDNQKYIFIGYSLLVLLVHTIEYLWIKK